MDYVADYTEKWTLRLPILIGFAIGTALGVMNLIDTARQPLADDDGGTMLVWLVAILAIWSGAVVAVTWRTQGIANAVKIGAILGVATMVVFYAAAIVRVNVFLDVIRYRDDWQNLVARYSQSGFASLRGYANYEYLTGVPVAIALGAMAGSVSGVIGGVVNATRQALRGATT